MKTTASHPKNTPVLERTVWKIVPLSLLPKNDSVTSECSMSLLPRYNNQDTYNICGRTLQDGDQQLANFLERIMQSPSISAFGVSTTIRIVLEEELDPTKDDNDDVVLTPLEQQHSRPTKKDMVWCSEDEREMVYEGWTLVQKNLRWNRFADMYRFVRQNMHLVSIPHPLLHYATQVLPTLQGEELDHAIQILQGKRQQKSRNPVLFTQQAIVDVYEQTPLTYTILVDPPPNNAPFDVSRQDHHYLQHSCLPNATWDVKLVRAASKEQQQLQASLVSTCFIEAGEDVSVARIDITTNYKQREQDLTGVFGTPKTSCQCCRCAYERDSTFPPKMRDVERLGNLAMQQGRYEDAQRLYQHLLLHHQQEEQADIWHASGAVYLQQQRFVTAQLYWKNAAEKHKYLKDHKGIALQLNKQEAYRYWGDDTLVGTEGLIEISPPPPPAYDVHFRGLCFITKDPIVSPQDCRKVIQWAEEGSGGWSTFRHYAVPTTDVAVHEEPVLLEWFMGFMETTVYPLLSRQFASSVPTTTTTGTDGNKRWFVHDAFVVRYEASSSNNHLPLHVDESTHSFVLALNDNFEGGGTYFVDKNQTFCPEKGQLLSFRGDSLRHGGNIVTKGVRYILAAFLYLDNPPDHHLPSPLDQLPPPKRCKLQHLFQDSTSGKKEDKKSSFSFSFDVMK